MTIPRYVCLESETEEIEVIQCLSSHVMQWDEHLWLLDIQNFRSFWKRQSQSLQQDIGTVWKDVLSRTLIEEASESDENIIALSPGFRASCAHDPWKAILLMLQMQERNIQGLQTMGSRLGQGLYQETPWKTWWHAVKQLEVHLATHSSKTYRQAAFPGKCKRFKQAMEQLNIESPWQMKQFNHTAMQRRYGALLANLWKWSVDESCVEDTAFWQSSFPWQTKKFTEAVTISRCLSYPLSFWQHIEPVLLEDLDKLCTLTSSCHQEAVTRLHWSLMLDDLSPIEVPILFRNPHELKSEKGHHKTALLQAYYGFLKAIEEQTPSGQALPGECLFAPIFAWDLSIEEKLVLTRATLDLFGEWHLENSATSELLELENQLSTPLHRYHYDEHWHPESAYQSVVLNDEKEVSPHAQRSLQAVAIERPLMVFKEPTVYSEPVHPAQLEFLEAVMGQWWNREAHERIYYKYTDPDRQELWIFRDPSGLWYLHGIFA